MKQLILYSTILICFSSCLQNLNVTEFFRKLEIKAPGYSEIITDNVAGFEAAITQEIEKKEDGTVEWITFWGESRYACGKVIQEIDGEKYVVVLGEFKMKNEKRSHTYSIHFIPDEKELITNAEINYSW